MVRTLASVSNTTSFTQRGRALHPTHFGGAGASGFSYFSISSLRSQVLSVAGVFSSSRLNSMYFRSFWQMHNFLSCKQFLKINLAVMASVNQKSMLLLRTNCSSNASKKQFKNSFGQLWLWLAISFDFVSTHSKKSIGSKGSKELSYVDIRLASFVTKLPST